MTSALAALGHIAAPAETGHAGGMTGVVVLVLALVVWHIIKRVFWPERPCPNSKCQGGKIYAPDGKSWRRHGRCDGKGYIS